MSNELLKTSYKLLSQLDILARHCDKFELFVRCVKMAEAFNNLSLMT